MQAGGSPAQTPQKRLDMTGMRSSLIRMKNMENCLMFRKSIKENVPILGSASYRD